MRSAGIALAFLLSCLVATIAIAADLSKRVAEAKAEIATALGAKYDEKLGPFIGEAKRSCIPPGTTAPENLGNFTFIARVGLDGKQREVEVEPSTRVATCFKGRFAAFTLPTPPGSVGSREGTTGYPIVVEMKITP